MKREGRARVWEEVASDRGGKPGDYEFESQEKRVCLLEERGIICVNC